MIKNIIEYLNNIKWEKINEDTYKKNFQYIKIERKDTDLIIDIWFKDPFGVVVKGCDFYVYARFAGIHIKKWIKIIKKFDPDVKLEKTYSLIETTSMIFVNIIITSIILISISLFSLIILYVYNSKQ